MKRLLKKYIVQIIFGISFLSACITLGIAVGRAQSGEVVPDTGWVFNTFAMSVVVATFSGLILGLKSFLKTWD